ncbi:MAG: hypothetical protein Q9227_008111 [Pyrenula ochraceoflavens]
MIDRPPGMDGRDLYHLACAVMSNQNVAYHIRKFEIRCPRISQQLEAQMYESDMARFASLVQPLLNFLEVQDPNAGDLAGLAEGRRGLYLIITTILTQATRIKELILSDIIFERETIQRKISECEEQGQAVDPTVIPLNAVESLTFTSEFKPTTIPVEFFVQFPSLTSLDLYFTFVTESELCNKSSSKLSNLSTKFLTSLTSLKIHSSGIQPQAFSQLLELCPNILAIDIGGMLSPVSRDMRLFCSVIFNSPGRPSLQSLSLTSTGDMDIPDLRPLNSLRSLRLKFRLDRVSYVQPLGEFLPDSIQYLSVSHIYKGVVEKEAVQKLFAAFDLSLYPKLGSISLEMILEGTWNVETQKVAGSTEVLTQYDKCLRSTALFVCPVVYTLSNATQKDSSPGVSSKAALTRLCSTPWTFLRWYDLIFRINERECCDAHEHRVAPMWKILDSERALNTEIQKLLFNEADVHSRLEPPVR